MNRRSRPTGVIVNYEPKVFEPLGEKIMNCELTKTCPRCGAKFTCHHDDDITKCQCNTVQLTQESRKYIAKNYDVCLCVKCLREILESKVWQNF